MHMQKGSVVEIMQLCHNFASQYEKNMKNCEFSVSTHFISKHLWYIKELCNITLKYFLKWGIFNIQ